MTHAPDAALMRHHGDVDLDPGLVDLAVNVRADAPPAWLTEVIGAVDLARYPDTGAARAAIAARHGRDVDEVLPTAGAAEAFTLIARAFAPRRAVVVHPQFTEPELALRAAGHAVDSVVLEPPFTLDPARIPADADLVVVGNPTNPTSVLHPAETMRALIRPGRLLVVDEAFLDCVPGEPQSLAQQRDGVIVVRSLTKTWGLAGLRAGYVLAAAGVVERLARQQPHWSVSTPALAACVACSAPAALDEAEAWARALVARREHLSSQLAAVSDGARASFLLVHTGRPRIWEPLRHKGFVVRRGDTFPGLGENWIRVAVRDEATSDAFAIALKECE